MCGSVCVRCAGVYVCMWMCEVHAHVCMYGCIVTNMIVLAAINRARWRPLPSETCKTLSWATWRSHDVCCSPWPGGCRVRCMPMMSLSHSPHSPSSQLGLHLRATQPTGKMLYMCACVYVCVWCVCACVCVHVCVCMCVCACVCVHLSSVCIVAGFSFIRTSHIS